MKKQTNLPCPDCSSSDALALYEDGHTYCFSCRTYNKKGKEILMPVLQQNKVSPAATSSTKTAKELPSVFNGIPDRGITKETAEVYGIRSSDTENWVHAYPYTKDGKHFSTQYRGPDKKFWFENFDNSLELFGQSAFPPGCANQITIVEGPLDAASAYQLLGSKYPVVAVMSAESAEREVRKNFKYLSSFDQIVICFDKDEPKVDPKTKEERCPGQEAAKKVAAILPLGKTRIMTLREHKDSNDYLMAKKHDVFVKEWWKAPTYTPSGLRSGKELWEDIITPPNHSSLPYPFYKIQEDTYGIRKSELVVIHAPTGVGKTTVLNEIEYSILQNAPDEKIGSIRIEETNRDSAIGLLSVHSNRRLHLPDVWETTDKEQLKGWYDEILNNDRVIFWDHFGSNRIEEVLNTVKYMHVLGCNYIFLDHLSIIVSDQQGDERKQLDEISTKLKKMCMELNIALVAVIHENRAGEIRGTAGVEQLANIQIKLERDKTTTDKWRKNVTKTTILKNRFCGTTGPSSYLYYSPDTGRLIELTDEEIEKYESGSTSTPEDQWA